MPSLHFYAGLSFLYIKQGRKLFQPSLAVAFAEVQDGLRVNVRIVCQYGMIISAGSWKRSGVLRKPARPNKMADSMSGGSLQHCGIITFSSGLPTQSQTIKQKINTCRIFIFFSTLHTLKNIQLILYSNPYKSQKKDQRNISSTFRV